MLQELYVKISSDFKELHAGITEAQSSLTTFGDNMKNVGTTMSTFVTLPIALAGAASIKLASDMGETTNKISVAFGEAGKDVMDWSKTSIESMGLAQQSALDAAALFGDMGTSMGLTQHDAAGMSMSLTQLGADLASFKNIDTKQAMEALGGVFTGETESLKMLGVVMTETNLEAFALTQGITKKVQAMTEAEKINLRYAFVMNATKNAQGDFARTSEGAANQMRMFGESLKEIGVQIGNIVLPAFTRFINVANNLLQKFMVLPESTKKIIVVVAALTAALGPLIFAAGTVITLLPLMKSGFLMIVPAIKAVGAAMSFLVANPIGAIVTAVAGLVAAFVYFYRTNDSFKGVVDGVINRISTAAIFLWKNVLVPLGAVIANLWNAYFLPFVKSLMQKVKPTIDVITYAFSVLWSRVLVPLGSFIGETLVVYFSFLRNAMNYLLEKALKPVANYLSKVFGPTFSIIFNAIKGFFQTFISAGVGLFNNWNKICIGMMQAINKAGFVVETTFIAMKKAILMQINVILKGLESITSFVPGLSEIVGKARKSISSLISEQDVKRQAAVMKYETEKIAINAKTMAKETNAAKNETQKLTAQVKESSFATQQYKVDLNALNATVEKSGEAKSKATKKEKEHKMAVDETAKAEDKAAEKRKELYENTVTSLNKLGEAIVNALKKRYAEQEKEEITFINEQKDREVTAQKESLNTLKNNYNKQLKALKDKNENEVKAIKLAQKEKLLIIDAETLEQLSAIQRQIDAIRNSTKNEERELDEQAHNNEVSNLQKKLNDAKTAEERAEIQANIDDKIAKRKREKLLEEREDTIDHLQRQMEDIKDNAAKRKEQLDLQTQTELDALELRQQNELEAAEQSYNIQEALLQDKLNQLEKHYEKEVEKTREKFSKLTNDEAIFEESRRLALKENQDELIKLLNEYNPKWQNAGQSFGQSMLDGLNSMKSSIQQAVNEIFSMVGKVAPEVAKQENALKKLANVSQPTSVAGIAAQAAIKSATIQPPAFNKPQPVDTLRTLNNMTQPTSVAGIAAKTAVNVYLDGRKVSNAVAPTMVDMIRGRVGSAY